MTETKPFDISKRLVWEAYKRVKANKGAAGTRRRFVSAGVCQLPRVIVQPERRSQGNLHDEPSTPETP